MKQRLGPGLGDLPLAKLTPQKIQAYNTGMLERLGNETVRLDFQILKAALDSAVAWGMLVRNPCTGVKAPRRKRSQMQVWTTEQVRALQRATEGEPCQEIWRVALGTAMRMGEILALRWSDVDLEKRVAQVTRTHYTGPEGRGIGDVKTAAGRRNIALAASCVQSLKARRVQVRPENEDDLIWDWSLQQVRWRFEQAQKGTGLPRIRFHDLRHTSATLMLLNGVHPKVVAERLGHSSVAITLDRYSHVLEGMQEEAAARLDALLTGDQMVTTAAIGSDEAA